MDFQTGRSVYRDPFWLAVNAFGYCVGMWPCRTTLSFSTGHQDTNTSTYSFDFSLLLSHKWILQAVDQITPNEHPHLSTNKADLIAQVSAFSLMDGKMPLRLLRLFSYPKATLCRNCEQYSVCCTVLIHFFNIWKCCFSLCLVLLLVNKPDCFWVTFLLWYFFP